MLCHRPFKNYHRPTVALPPEHNTVVALHGFGLQDGCCVPVEHAAGVAVREAVDQLQEPAAGVRLSQRPAARHPLKQLPACAAGSRQVRLSTQRQLQCCDGTDCILYTVKPQHTWA
jgi:hypothetical protein